MTEIIGRLGYVGPMAERPINHPVPGLSNLTWDWREVPIRDASELPGGAKLEKHGFTTLPHRSAIDDWDGDKWKYQFTQEAIEIIKRATGASEVLVTRNSGRLECPFVVRSSRFAGNQGPVSFCHNDFTAGSAARHLAADYPKLVRGAFTKRFAIYNLWHLISPPPQSDPLAICDATSVAAADLVPAEAQYGNSGHLATFGENALFRYNQGHRWYYYPGLRTDETLVWSGYDSDPAFPSIVPHCSFHDPSCQDPAAQRTNVNGSVYAFFE